MTSDNSEINNQLKVTSIIYYSLIGSMLIFCMVVIILVQGKAFNFSRDIDKVFILIVPAYGMVMMFLSRMIYNQMITKFDKSMNILRKISHYRTVKIICWAVIESSCLLAIVATMLTSNYLYVVVFIFLIGYLIMIRPSRESLVRDLSMNSNESSMILRNHI